MNNPKFYLEKAAECFARAEDLPPEARGVLIALAEQYTRLAEYAAKERDALRPESPNLIEEDGED